MSDATGLDEWAWITTQAKTLAGGRYWDVQVPDDVQLPRETNGKVKPYIIGMMQSPFALESGRSIAVDESRQPHVMPFMLVAYAGDPQSAAVTAAAVKRKMLGKIPSGTAGQIAASGGFSYAESDTDSKPTRFASGCWFRVPINLGI